MNRGCLFKCLCSPVQFGSPNSDCVRTKFLIPRVIFWGGADLGWHGNPSHSALHHVFRPKLSKTPAWGARLVGVAAVGVRPPATMLPHAVGVPSISSSMTLHHAQQSSLMMESRQMDASLRQAIFTQCMVICCAMHLNFPSHDTHSRPFHWKVIQDNLRFSALRNLSLNMTHKKEPCNLWKQHQLMQSQFWPPEPGRDLCSRSESLGVIRCHSIFANAESFRNTYHSNWRDWIWSTKQFHRIRIPACQIWYGIQIACFLPGNCCDARQYICFGWLLVLTWTLQQSILKMLLCWNQKTISLVVQNVTNNELMLSNLTDINCTTMFWIGWDANQTCPRMTGICTGTWTILATWNVPSSGRPNWRKTRRR